MPQFTVTWVIDEEAEDHEDAARQARARLLDPESIADIFTVAGEGEPVIVDLSALDGRPVG